MKLEAPLHGELRWQAQTYRDGDQSPKLLVSGHVGMHCVQEELLKAGSSAESTLSALALTEKAMRRLLTEGGYISKKGMVREQGDFELPCPWNEILLADHIFYVDHHSYLGQSGIFSPTREKGVLLAPDSIGTVHLTPSVSQTDKYNLAVAGNGWATSILINALEANYRRLDQAPHKLVGSTVIGQILVDIALANQPELQVSR